MRIFDLSNEIVIGPDGKAVIADVGRLVAMLDAYIAWPEDVAARNRYLAARAAKGTLEYVAVFDDILDTLHSRRKSEPVLHPITLKLERQLQMARAVLLDDMVHDFGGLASVIDAQINGPPMKNALKRAVAPATLAGARLLLVAIIHHHHADQLRGGAGLGKAADLICHQNRHGGGPRSARAVELAWRSHRHVAHLMAGVICAEQLFQRGELQVAPRTSRDGIVLWLQFAQELLHFGVSQSAERVEHPYLDPEQTYRLPITLPSIDLADVLTPLDSDDLEFLMHRRADGR